MYIDILPPTLQNKLDKTINILSLIKEDATFYGLLFLFTALVQIYFENKFLFTYGGLLEGLEKKDPEMFQHALFNTVALTLLQPLVHTVLKLVVLNIKTLLSSKLSNSLLENYFLERIYYETKFLTEDTATDEVLKLKQNTIQKALKKDVDTFMDSLTSLFSRVISPIVKLCTVSVILLELMQLKFVILIGLVTLFFSFTETKLNVKYMTRMNKIYQTESSISNKIQNLANFAEEIAFWRSEKVELDRLSTAFNELYEELRSVSTLSLGYNFIYRLEGDFYSIAVYLIFYDKLFFGTMSLAQIQEVNFALREIMYAAWTVRSSSAKTYISLSQAIDSLHFLAKARTKKSILEQNKPRYMENIAVDTDISQSLIVVEQLSLFRYNLKGTLLNNLNFRINKGDKVYVQGSNGRGKTSLFRALAGLLPEQFISMESKIHTIGVSWENGVMFMPQNAFLAPQTSLREQVLYPQKENNMTDQEILSIVNKVGLGTLVTGEELGPNTVDKLNEVRDDWSGLSGGQKQMVCFARALIAKPKLLFMDEVSSGLTEQYEHKLYSMLSEQQELTYVSIGHRKSLLKFHNKVLKIAADGTACLEALDLLPDREL
eukprot:maker-scaffold_4-snap-gene-13.50-mRNA-1 protein AED:0.02 eAED:0.02 QI:39/1/1/1/0.5/0.66/3/155/602